MCAVAGIVHTAVLPPLLALATTAHTLATPACPLWQLEPMHSNVTTSTLARSAPLWLPAEQQHSTTSLPNVQSGGSGPAGSGSGLSPPQASSELPGGAGTDSPAFTSKELSTLLSDWEIRPEGKKDCSWVWCE